MTDTFADGTARRKLVVGNIGGPFGVRGWVKVISHSDPRENIFKYTPWLLKIGREWQTVELEDGRPQGKGLVAKLADIDDCDQAITLTNVQIAIYEDQLPSLGEDEFYWRDLIGLEVVNQDGVNFGVVRKLIETGANDVLEVHGERERLLPYIDQVIQKVDLVARRIDVDWDADF
jgi:16S rRNA processing protein RimM